MTPNSSTRICIVRHGETDWNAEKRLQGHIDIPLNATGHSQASAAAQGLSVHRFSAIYSSDLGRARQTAEAAAIRFGLPVTPEVGLRERHYGCLQGLTLDEARLRHPEAHAYYRARDVHYDYSGGESLTAFALRVTATIERLAADHPGETVLLVAHGGVLDIIYRRAAGRDLVSPRDFDVPNAALNWINVGGGDWRLISWADRRHLEQTMLQAVE